MTFDPTLINFLTVGNFASNPSYDVPLSQQLVAAPSKGIYFQNAGGGSTYTLNTSGNLAALMALQNTSDYGIVISVPQSAGGIITRRLRSSSTIEITNPSGQSGDFSIDVIPSTTLQLIQPKINGSNAGSPHSVLNLVAGSNIGLSYVDTGTQTNLTINSVSTTAGGPFVTYTADSDLPGAQNIGLLSSGLLKNTVTAGSALISRAIPGTDYLLPNANLAAFAALTPANGNLLYFTGGAWNLLAPSGTNGQILTTISGTSVGWTNGSAQISLWANYAAVANVNFNGFKGVSALDPTAAQDVATKNYVDLHAGGAPVGAGYVLTQSSGSLTGASNLGALSSGLLKISVSAGIATPSTIQNVTITPTAMTSSFITGSFTGSQSVTMQAGVQTTNATTTNLFSVALNASESVTITGTITGATVDHTDTTGGFFFIVAKRDTVSGNVSLVGTPWIMNSADSAGIISVIADIPSQSVIVQVTGLSSTNYNWDSTYSYQKVLTNS